MLVADLRYILVEEEKKRKEKKRKEKKRKEKKSMDIQLAYCFAVAAKQSTGRNREIVTSRGRNGWKKRTEESERQR